MKPDPLQTDHVCRVAFVLDGQETSDQQTLICDLARCLGPGFVLHAIMPKAALSAASDFWVSLKDLGVLCDALQAERLDSWSGYKALKRMATANGIDVLHTFGLRPTVVARNVCLFVRGCKRLATIASMSSFLEQKTFFNLWQRHVLRSCSWVVFGSVSCQLTMNQLLALRRSSVIRQGLSLPESQSGFKRRFTTVFFKGPLNGFCGWEDVLKAFALVWPGRLNVRLVIIADTDDFIGLDKLIANLKIDFHVIRAQGVEAQKYFTNAAVCVVPALKDFIPCELLMAMSHGRPIVATDLPAIRECVSHEQSAMLVRPRDIYGLAFAIKTLLEDAELAARLGDQAKQQFVASFDLTAMIEKYRTVYRVIAESSE